MSAEDGSSVFLSVYGEVTGRHQGSFVPEEAALGISEATGIGIEDIRAALHHPPAEGTLYPDAVRFLAQLAETEGQYVSIWTQGEMATSQGGAGYQLKKVGQAGISGLLDPGWRTRNSLMGLPRVLGDIYRKSDALASIMPSLLEGGFETVVVVDDKPANHVMSRQALEDEGWGATDHYLMARSNNGNGHDDDFPVHSVKSFDEIPLEDRAGSRVLWLVDLDYTLIDHRRVVEQYSRRIDELSGTAA